jgi:D-serine deaminase-like pyridoxal phosphate-dependent protein
MEYKILNTLFKNHKAPFAWLDLNALDENIATITSRAKGKNIRIATKSIRCRFVLDYLLEKLPHSFGLMAFTLEEALWLSELGFTNILMGYPTYEKQLIEKVFSNPIHTNSICFMVDKLEHIEVLNEIAVKHNAQAKICVDVDMSSTFPGIYFGVYRSSIKNAADLKSLIRSSSSFSNIKWKGLMGYEAQIAGIGDNVPGSAVMNKIIGVLKSKSIKEIAERRSACLKVLSDNSINLDFVNGGGTGSIESTLKEVGVTEITVGSGFYQSHLFDNYSNFKHKPALFYALRIVRKPTDSIFTALGGGYIASGATHASKQPQPFLPKGMKLIKNEGAGEVQTPFEYKGKELLKIGDLVFFRHAKAGELCERFNELILVRANKIEQIVPTYRGEQKCFL